MNINNSSAISYDSYISNKPKRKDTGLDVPDFVNDRYYEARANASAPKIINHPCKTKPKGTKCNHHGDTFHSKKHVQSNKKQSSGLTKAGIVAIPVGLLTSLLMALNVAQTELPKVDTNFDANNHSVSDTAEFTGVDPKAIALANGVSLDDVVNDIVLPEKVASDERWTVYADEDEKLAYIIPEEHGILIEDVKKAYGIPDGVVAKYNDISYTWGSDDNSSETITYKDYSDSKIPYEGIVVPYDSTNLD